jgi:ribonuclease HI
LRRKDIPKIKIGQMNDNCHLCAMAKKQKYYVVWVGAKPGIYTSWDDAKAQVMGFPTAKYKSFDTLKEAEEAFKKSHSQYYNFNQKEEKGKPQNVDNQKIIHESLSVDAACSGNPGDMEYRGVYTRTGKQIFHQGPFKEGTNNVGEFLALVHALALLKREGKTTTPIYTDSRTAMAWVRNKKVKTELKETPQNEKIFDLIDRALAWLNNNTYENPIIKWETEVWGEIPADFGRK